MTRPPPSVVVARFTAEELELLESAATVMGSASLNRFLRSASLTLAGAILQAARDGDLRPGERVTAWIGDASLERAS